MPRRGTETDFELTTIERLLLPGYDYQHGEELARPHEEVVLRDILRGELARRYPDLPDPALDQVVARFARPEGVDTLRRNLAFHRDLTRGFEIKVERPDGQPEHRHVYAIDWSEPTNNRFLVVNQLSIRGRNDRRPDLVIYVNGLPLAVFELKNPYSDRPTVEHALNQLGHYRNDIPQLFEFNALTVVSDGVTTLHGTWTASPEWYAPWKSIDGHNVEANTTGSMKTLIAGLFPRDRLLAYVRNFVVFEESNEKLTKKGAKYHQFFAVLEAARRVVDACRPDADRRIGVVWHTTGSGKSLSMTFLVGLLRRHPDLQNPTFLVQVDRNDLDRQLLDQFVAARSLVGDVEHADDVDMLRSLLRSEGGAVIVSTIQKFRLKAEPDGGGEIEHPTLSDRSNIIVIADEAHRTQYGFEDGFARSLRDALPRARFLGFTGTPVSFGGADTVAVFGDLIHVYDIKQSQEDKATVPIYYAPRQAKLHLSHLDLDSALGEITADAEIDDLERKKGRWAALAALAGAKKRVKSLAADLLDHFRDRTATLAGKGMIVCMTRSNCVRMYDALSDLPDCPEIKVVMTGNLNEDPAEWSRAGHLTTKPQRDAIKKRMIDPDDPLKLVIVCDMWLTGTDIPCLHTLYVDKPMKGHNIIQAISRVNRVFRDKPHGLIVDYIGIGDELREAANRYAAGGGRGNPAPSVSDEARPIFQAALEAVRELLPPGIDYGDWRRLSNIALEDRFALVYGHLTEHDERRDAFLQAELRLSQSFLLVKHLDDCRASADEVIFCQRVRNQLLKAIPGRRPVADVEKAVRDLVDDSIESEGVVDIFRAAGIDRPDLSILDDEFLQTFKDQPLPNLRLKLLEKLLDDAIHAHQRKNPAGAKSFSKLIEETLRKYHNRLIDAAAVIQAIAQIHRDLQAADQRAAELGLGEDELAFYDAIAQNFNQVYEIEFLRDLVHEIVLTIKKNLRVDWTEPHREDVKSAVRAAVRRTLRNRGVKAADLEAFTAAIMTQATVLYSNPQTSVM